MVEEVLRSCMMRPEEVDQVRMCWINPVSIPSFMEYEIVMLGREEMVNDGPWFGI